MRLQIDADVDTALLRREMERARGTTGGESATPTARPAGPSLLVGSDSSEEASTTVVKTLAAGGVQVQAAAVRDEPSLVAAAGRQAAQALWLVATSASEGSIRGASSVSVRCELRARLLPGGLGARPALLDHTQTEGDSPATRPPHGLRAGSAPPRPWRANCPPCFGPFPRVRVT